MALIVIFSLISSAPLLAQRHGRGPVNPGREDCPNMQKDSTRGWGEGFCKAIPGITKEQLDKIEKSRVNMEMEQIPFINQRGEKEAHLKTLNAEDNVDQAAIDKTIEEIAALNVKIAKLRNRHLQEIRSLLTKEQKVYFDSHRMRGPGNGTGQMSGQHHRKNFKRQVMPCPASQMK